MSEGSGQAQERWTTRRLLAWTADYFTRRGVDSPRLSAEMLLAHVLGVERIKLYTDLDRPTSDLERAAYRELVERAAQHEPVDYLVGQAPFFSMTFAVNRAVLIPRPSTETLVEHVIQHHRRTPGFHGPLIADVGTGSGAIAIAIAKHIPTCRVVATDQSAAALEVAKRNAKAHGVADRIDFRQGNLLEPLADQVHRVRYLLSNPPYISDAEWEAVGPNVKDYEPTEALRGGVDGLKYIRPLLAGASELLGPPAQVLIEIAAAQKQEVLRLAGESPGLSNPRVLADHEGLPRVRVADAM
ncbi:MAG: peptide chain release factor N(5)-glutamine methyltransferase [Phycisphaeraceae bacterium]|nr:peptide chain release factor N(5)-glutamine methyltransferase [Phycisphaeraceae bacterium]